MAKPFIEYAGNGMHVHASMLDGDGRNVLAGEDGKKNLGGVILGLNLVYHPLHGPGTIDDKGLPVNTVILPAHEFFRPPDPVGFDDFFIHEPFKDRNSIDLFMPQCS